MAVKKIILASASPRRKEILERHHFQVQVLLPPSHVEEISLDRDHFPTPEAVVLENAQRKNLAVGEHPDWVLASDTLVFCEGVEYGKPKDLEEASMFLGALSGKTHQVYSSFFLRRGTHVKKGFDCSHVTFKKLTFTMIRQYIQNIPVLDKAGGYAIQDGGVEIIASYQGSYYNIMGLPIEKIIPLLEE